MWGVQAVYSCLMVSDRIIRSRVRASPFTPAPPPHAFRLVRLDAANLICRSHQPDPNTLVVCSVAVFFSSPVLCSPPSFFLFQQGPKCNMMQSVATGARPCTLLWLPLARLLRAQKEEKMPRQHGLTITKSIKIQPISWEITSLPARTHLQDQWCLWICRTPIRDDDKALSAVSAQTYYSLCLQSVRYLTYSNALNQKRTFSTKQNWPLARLTNHPSLQQNGFLRRKRSHFKKPAFFTLVSSGVLSLFVRQPFMEIKLCWPRPLSLPRAAV